MKHNTAMALLYLMTILCFGSSCTHMEEPMQDFVGIHLPPGVSGQEGWRDSVYSDSPIRMRHKDTPLKILAIGNSFTANATTYLPWLVDKIDADSVCIARLTKASCSLSMHWKSHIKNSSDYYMFYSDAGMWYKEDISCMDEALTVLEWDIITIQQVSGDSGRYDTFQPYLYNLLALFRESNPDVKTAWHSTWPYRAGCTYSEFSKYGRDPGIMYEAILYASSQASSGMDFFIPSTDLIWGLRQDYPEVADGFSTDGFHISDAHALHALSLLWYEILISPYSGKSALELNVFPEGVDGDFMPRALSIIGDITGRSGSDDSVVGLTYPD